MIRRLAGESPAEFRARLEVETFGERGQFPATHAAWLDAHPDLRDTAEIRIGLRFIGMVATQTAEVVGGYFTDLYRSLTTPGGSVDAMAKMDEALAIADLVMLAIVADGTVTEEEIVRLEALHKDREIPELARKALEDFRARMPAVRSDDDLAGLAATILPRVSAEGRRGVLETVVAMARAGSGATTSATYREASRSDPRALVDRFAALLGVDSDAGCA